MFSINGPLASPGHSPRVLLVTRCSIAAGPSCIKNEFEALETSYAVTVAVRDRAAPVEEELERLEAVAREARADILHTHYLGEIAFIARLAELTGLPFTVRTHSTDTTALQPRGLMLRLRQLMQMEAPLERRPEFLNVVRAVHSERCLGVLALPCARPWLARAGLPQDKLIDCFPAMRFRAFHDRSPNGDAIMNIGLAGSRKARPDFMRLAAAMQGAKFDLYADAEHLPRLARRNSDLRAGVDLFELPPSEQRPAEYKAHRWLVYTGDSDLPALGWPVAIAEAQAAGVGVCMPRLRPDLAEYVGEGAGVLYDTIDELPGIVAGSVPEEMRERGFRQARKSDIEQHLHCLTDLWDVAVPRPARPAAIREFPAAGQEMLP